jgi:Flp pilus assembly protein TadG
MRLPLNSGRLHRRGGVLVEFAIIALVLYLLLAVTIELGRAIFGSQTIQAAADLAAREISRAPLSVTYTSLYGTGPADTTAALNDPTVRQRIYDERLLVIDLAQNPGDPTTIIQTFPVVNQQLFPLMIFDTESIPGRSLLRYPGALVTPGNEKNLTAVPTGFTDSQLRVVIPLVVSRSSTGVETITWVSVLEEITPGAFSLTSTSPQAGMVGVRLNYPYQAAALSAYQSSSGSIFAPNGTNPVVASDAGVTQQNSPASLGEGSPVVPADPSAGTNQGLQPYGGEFGLGFQLAMGQRLRPFSRLVSGQGLYRREVFNP